MSEPFTISPSRVTPSRICPSKVAVPRRHRLIDLSLLVAVAGLFVWALLL
jgi:hypothetical protein